MKFIGMTFLIAFVSPFLPVVGLMWLVSRTSNQQQNRRRIRNNNARPFSNAQPFRA